MKRFTVFILAVLILSLTGCKNLEEASDKNKIYDITIACAEESTEESRIITYWNDRAVSNSGMFKVRNLNDFPITVYLDSEGKEEISLELSPKEEKTVENLKIKESYQVGVYADVKENDEIKISITDGN